jgi:multimeric flavodoxin WrbA
MVEAAARGALEESRVIVDLKHASLCKIEDVLTADGYLFASPENLAAMSGMLKDFFDRTYYQGLGHLNSRPYCILICAGSDGENAARQIARCAAGWRLRAVAEPLIISTRAQTREEILAPKTIPESHLKQCYVAGATLASGLELGIF